MSSEDFRARGVLYVPDIARLSWLVDLPESEDLGANVDLAMDAIEKTNSGLRGVLPRGYQKLEKGILLELVRLFAPLPRTVSGDAFGLIYEYFLRSSPPSRAVVSGVGNDGSCESARGLAFERRGRDLNPGGACTPNGFRDRPVRPLRHPSETTA